MNRRALIAFLRTSAIVVLALMVAPQAVPAQRGAPPPTPYNPYPPGILPADLQSELDRVSREVNLLFQQALAESRALPPPFLTGQPPTLQGSGVQMVQTLGKLMNYDMNMSPFKNVACASCHMPYAGFSGPIPSVNLTMIAYPDRFASEPTSGPRSDTHIPPGTRCSSSTQPNSCSLVETSGTHGRPDTCCRILTPSRHSILPSILEKWAYRTRRASRSGCPRPCTDRSSSRCGAWARSISSSRPTPRRSAQPLEGRRCSAPTPRR